MTLSPGYILFWSSPGDDMIALAKNFIKNAGLTAADVRLIKNEIEVRVEAVKEILWL